MPKKPKRRVRPDDIVPMHHIEEVGGRQEANVFQDTEGEFEIQTRRNVYSLPDQSININAEKVIIQKARAVRYTARDVKSIAPVSEAGIRGGIHSENTFLVRMLDGSEWFYKTGVAEERDELFAYEVAQLLFPGIVPEVRLVDLGKGIGSMMRRVDGVPAANADGIHGYFHGNQGLVHDLAAIVVLDFLVGNTDRHEGNWFVTHDGHLAAIDNGFCGYQPEIAMKRCLRPAKFSGVYKDPELWSQFLLYMMEIVKDAQGRGKEVRTLADRVGLNSKDADALCDLWEAKMAGLKKEVARQMVMVARA